MFEKRSSSRGIFGERQQAAADVTAVLPETKPIKPPKVIDISAVITDIKAGKQVIFIPPQDATSDEAARIRESLRSSEVQKDFFDALKNSNVQELHLSKIPKEFFKQLIEFFKNIKKDKIKNQIIHLSIAQSDSVLRENLLDLMKADGFEGKAMLLRKSMLSLARLDLSKTGYDLSLMCVDDEKQIDEFVQAKKRHMPILIWIKNKNEYRVFGDKVGDGVWCSTKVRTAMPHDLPFEEKILSRSDMPPSRL